MRKFLLSSLLSVALMGSASAATVTLNWTLPAASSATLTGIQIFDLAGTPPANVLINTTAPTATTFTTGALVDGQHTFTAVAVYSSGSATPSNSVVLTLTTTLPPVTNLTGTINP
jgi:hypothetical protein